MMKNAVKKQKSKTREGDEGQKKRWKKGGKRGQLSKNVCVERGNIRRARRGKRNMEGREILGGRDNGRKAYGKTATTHVQQASVYMLLTAH